MTLTPSSAPRARSPCGRSAAASPSRTSSSGSRCETLGRIFPASAHSHQRLEPHLAERGISPHRFAGADAEHAGALDQQQIGPGEPDAAGKADHQQPRAPGDAAHAVLEHLAADGIEHHVGAAPVGDALDGIAERLAASRAPDDRRRAPWRPRASPRSTPPRSRSRRASCPSRPRPARRRRRRRAPAAPRPA